MERLAQPKKRYQSASFLTSGAVFYGTVLFLAARVFRLLQLFSDAYTRNRLDQAPPENFTFFGIVGSLLIIGVIGLAFYLQLMHRRGRLRMKQGNYYLLLNALFVVWGVVNAVSYLVEMILFFEFVYLLDFVTLITALVVPCVLYQLSDRRQDIPPDNALLASAIAATGLSVIAMLIVALVLRKSYTSMQLLRELMFRAGIILFGAAGLLKAVRLRAELPELVAAMPKLSQQQPKEKPKPKSKKKPDPRGRVECPDCGKKLNPDVRICPRCGYDLDTPDLFGDDEDDLEPDDGLEETYEDAFEDDFDEEKPGFELELEEEPTPAVPERQELPKDICPRCGRKKPPFLTTCPHCGYYPGDPLEIEEQEAEQKKQVEAETPLAQQPPPATEEPKCEKCGRKIPGGLATCPYCGFHPDDARAPEPPPPSQQDAVESLFDKVEEEEDYIFCPRCDYEVPADTEVCPHCGHHFVDRFATGRIQRPTQRLPRVPDPRRLTAKNSIECPECGRRYSAARDRCPYCGFGLYDE